MKSEDDLIYDLIFSEVSTFEIDITEYFEDVFEYENFVLKIKKILRKAKVKIVKSNINLGTKTIIWELKVKK